MKTMGLGFALIIIGIIIIGASAVFPMASLLYVEIYASIPSGTYAEPSFLSKGSSLPPTLVISEQSNSVKVEIVGQDYDYQTSMAMPLYRTIQYQSGYTNIKYYYEYQAEYWTAPSDAPLNTKFAFIFYIEDNAVLTTYAVVTEISGYFTINGYKMTQETSLTLTNPELTIEFFDTSSSTGLIQKCYFRINDGTYYDLEQISEQKWQGTYTLPKHGRYKIEGFFSTNTEVSKVMSVFTIWGDTENGDESEETDLFTTFEIPEVNRLTYVGIVVAGLGFILTFLPIGWRPK